MERRYNKNYSENCEIIHAEPVREGEIVLAKAETSLGIMWITWFCMDVKSYCHGHYFLNDFKAATEDFNYRVQLEMGCMMEG